MPSDVDARAPAWTRAILHLDMDAFYVNVHLLDHPEDRGVPLVVGGQADQRGVVSSASYEARQLGIHSAMPTSRAARMVPGLRIVPANWSQIRVHSRQVMAVLEGYGPLEQVSVDEAYIDLSAQEDPVATAAAIKEEVRTSTALPCSVGVAMNKLVAKIASDHDKPDGFTVVQPGKEASFLAPKPTRAIWGIGPRTAERLGAIQIHTCGQLAGAKAEQVQAALGKHGLDFIRRAQGIDSREIRAERGQAKSISQEWTFGSDVNDAERLEAQIETMCQSITESLRKKGLVAHTVTVKIRRADFTTFTRQKSYEVGFDREEELRQRALVIWRENWRAGQFIRLIGVGVSNLAVPTVRQLHLPLDASGPA